MSKKLAEANIAALVSGGDRLNATRQPPRRRFARLATAIHDLADALRARA